MKNKAILLMIMAILLLGKMKAQQNLDAKITDLNLVHITGIYGIDLNGGIGGNNCYNFELGYYKYINPKWIYKVGINYENTPFPEVSLTDYTVKSSFLYTVYSLKLKLFFDLGAGGMIGVENNPIYSPADDITFSYPAATNFIYGVYAEGNIEYLFSKKVGLVLSGQQMWFGGSNWGNLKYQVNLGFRFAFQ